MEPVPSLLQVTTWSAEVIFYLLLSQIIFENRGYSSDVFYHISYIGLTQLFCFKRSEHSFAHIDFAFYIIDYLKLSGGVIFAGDVLLIVVKRKA